MKRIQSTYIFDESINNNKMIFLSGPRQVGKTTFSVNILKENKSENLYFNWDDPFVYRSYKKNPHFLDTYLAETKGNNPVVVFDEIHKINKWKNILKGLYDIYKERCRFLITGSARLEYFTKSGDSLIGRYFHYRMLPLGLSEINGNLKDVFYKDEIFLKGKSENLLRFLKRNNKIVQKEFNDWMRFGGFPEPFIKKSDNFLLKWQKNYLTLLTKEDIKDLTKIGNIKGLEQLVLILPDKIGSPLSVNSIKEDLEVTHKTVVLWLESLKKVYMIFSIMPWTDKINRALKKEQKYYFYDWTIVKDESIRFENAAAVSLLRLIYRWNELGIGDFDLRYIRDRNKNEVDFIIIKNNQPLLLIECKLHDTKLSKTAVHFSKILNVPYIQMISDEDVVESYGDDRYIISASIFLNYTG